MSARQLAENWTDIAAQLLKIGATAYGGPAIMGVMQAEPQEKRQWVSKERFMDGLSLVNMLPGATAAQLGIFLGYTRAGWWGGLLGGLCFVLPGFLVLMALTMGYAALGVTPLIRGALYGLGPVVLGIYVVAVYRLGRAALSMPLQTLIAVAAAVAALATTLGIVSILLLAGGVGLWLFHSRKLGVAVLVPLAACLAIFHIIARWVSAPGSTSGHVDGRRAGREPRAGRYVPPQSRRLHVRRRPHDDRVHPGAGGEPMELAHPAGVHRRPCARPAHSGTRPDGRGVRRLQGGRARRRGRRQSRRVPAVLRHDAGPPSRIRPSQNAEMDARSVAGHRARRDRRPRRLAGTARAPR